jgi:elongation factor Ts
MTTSIPNIITPASQPEPATQRGLRDVSEPGRSGRIETYLHSDAITQHKGGAMVKVTCDTDFTARTNEFYLFCRKVAQMAYASDATCWVEVEAAYPLMVEDLAKIKAILKENIIVAEIKVMKL